MNLKTVQTPALLLDLDKFTRNCNWMKEKAERLHVALRPHLKTGKCIEFARTQMTAPSGPATVSTLLEAEYFLFTPSAFLPENSNAPLIYEKPAAT